MLGRLTTALLLATLSTVTQGRPDAEQELADIQQRLAQAWRAADRQAIERLIAADWTVTGPDGRVSTRAEVLRDVFETRVHRIASLEIDNVHVRVFGEAAVITGRTRGRGSYRDAAYDATIRFTDVFVRRGGEWQAVASHASLLTAGR